MSFEQHQYTGDQQDQYDFLSQHTSPTPGWITGEDSAEDSSDPVQLNFRHGHSQGNEIDIKYNTSFAKLKAAHGDENSIPQEERFALILQYLLEKVTLGNDNNAGLTDLGRSQALDVNKALRTSIETSGKNINQISISPYRRTLETAAGILDGIVEVDYEELLRNGQGIRKGNTIIQIDKRLEERDFGTKVGYYHWWARGFLKKALNSSSWWNSFSKNKTQKDLFIRWLQNEGAKHFSDLDDPNDVKRKVIEVLRSERDPEPYAMVAQRTRTQMEEALQRTHHDEFSIAVTHAGVIKRIAANLTNPGDSHGIEKFVTLAYEPRNLSLSITGYDPESGLYLAGYNLRPKE